MNKLQASQYLYAKGPGTQIKAVDGSIFEILSNGDIISVRSSNSYEGLRKDWEPFSIIEPEKSNEELAVEAANIWLSNPNSLGPTFKFIFDAVDQKIKGIKS